MASATTSSEQVTRMSQSLRGLTILVAPDDPPAELTEELSNHGARVLTWPRLEIVPPDSFAALDEAIENLFGYDWLILPNVNAADFFLRRFQDLGHQISELDARRVCALDEGTQERFEESQVHVDLVPDASATTSVIAALGTYVGCREALTGLNLLFPRAAISRDQLPQALEDAGARVDVVPVYHAAGPNNSELVQLSVLIESGGIDCLVFTSPANVRVFSQVFDTSDLSPLLREVAVACADLVTTQAARTLGLRAPIISPSTSEVAELVSAIASHFQSPSSEP